MSYLKVTNFTRFQHYKNRKPVWIKFYVELLDPHHPINRLPVPTRLLFDRLLLLAAEWGNSIPKNPEFIASVTGIPHEDCREGLDLLLKGRWLSETKTKRRASKPASATSQKLLETELELEKEKEPKAVMSQVDATRDPANGNNGNGLGMSSIGEIIDLSLRGAA